MEKSSRLEANGRASNEEISCLVCYLVFKGPPVECVHCHRYMARRQVTEGGDGLQVWNQDANILNKQSRAAENGWSSSLGVGLGLTVSQQKRICSLTKCYTGPRTSDGIFGTI
jgi:hypothetical protein